MVVVLAGGVGAARFLRGLVEVVPGRQITVIANTGDDKVFYGLHVSPDIDINLYTLAGVVNPETGWGIHGDTFHVLEELKRYGQETWFALGDRDLATHLYRTQRLRDGLTLTAVTQELAQRWGLEIRLLPMSDDPVATHIRTPAGELHFQDYLVRRRSQDRVLDVRFHGIEKARPAPGVREALREAEGIIIPPSNPIVSVGTILSVPGVRQVIRESGAPVVAISPIIAGKTVKGPADRLLRALGYEVSALGVARYYGDLLGGMVIDERDRDLVGPLQELGLRVEVTDTMLDSVERRRGVACVTVELLARLRGADE